MTDSLNTRRPLKGKGRRGGVGEVHVNKDGLASTFGPKDDPEDDGTILDSTVQVYEM